MKSGQTNEIVICTIMAATTGDNPGITIASTIGATITTTTVVVTITIVLAVAVALATTVLLGITTTTE
jgi:hypothetical protein